MFVPVTVDSDKRSQHSITTLWLLSLLSKRQLNNKRNECFAKISKKNIIDVSIPDTCQLLQNDRWDIPLKQISHLLYGVSLCYTKKTDFVLEELIQLLNQLQRSLAITEKHNENTVKERKYRNHVHLNGTKLTTEFSVFEDDPSFDINNIPNFEFYISNPKVVEYKKQESIQIKKRDFLNELTNINILTDNNCEISGPHTTNRNFTLEELPIEFDLDLNMGEIISQHGTSVTSSSSVHKHGPDFQFREERKDSFLTEERFNPDLNEVMDFDLDIQPITGNNFGVSENPNQAETESLGDKGKRKHKITLTGRRGKGVLKKIKVDARISLLNETLKNNYDTYLESMKDKREKRIRIPDEDLFEHIKYRSNNTNLLDKCWNFTFSRDLERLTYENGNKVSYPGGNSMDSIDIGRRAVNISENSNIFLEADRDSFIGQDERFSQDILLHLDQIGEELEEQEQDPGMPFFENNSNFMKQPLKLPSSSIGHSTTRSSSDNTIEERRDFIDILKMSKNNETLPVESQLQPNDSIESFIEKRKKKMKTISNQQAMKFYSYLCSKYDQLKHVSRERGPVEEETVNKELTFNYLIPTEVEDFETRSIVPMTKRLAANAFFSLLDLASQEVVEFVTPTSQAIPICFDNFAIIL